MKLFRQKTEPVEIKYDITFIGEGGFLPDTRVYSSLDYLDYEDPLAGMIDHTLKTHGLDTEILRVEERDQCI